MSAARETRPTTHAFSDRPDYRIFAAAVALAGLLDAYGRSMDSTIEILKREGDPDKILAAIGETRRFEEERTVPKDADAKLPDVIREVQSGYNNAAKKAEVKKDKQFGALTERYITALDRLMRSLAAEEKLDLSLNVKTEKGRAEFALADVESRLPSRKMNPNQTGRVSDSDSPGQLSSSLKHKLVLHYDFGKDEGGKVSDKSGQGHTGRVRGAKWTRRRLAAARKPMDGALEFDGKSAYVDVPSFNPAKHIGNGNSYTLGLWYKQDSDPSKQVLIGHVGRFYLLSEGSYEYRVGWGNQYTRVFKLPVSPVNTWTYLAAVCDAVSNEIGVYQNAKPIHLHRYSGNKRFKGGRLSLGKQENYGFLNGSIDDVMIWGRALSESEIKRVYEQTGGK